MQILLRVICIGLNQEQLIHEGGQIDGLQHKQLDSLNLRTCTSLWFLAFTAVLCHTVNLEVACATMTADMKQVQLHVQARAVLVAFQLCRRETNSAACASLSSVCCI